MAWKFWIKQETKFTIYWWRNPFKRNHSSFHNEVDSFESTKNTIFFDNLNFSTNLRNHKPKKNPIVYAYFDYYLMNCNLGKK